MAFYPPLPSPLSRTSSYQLSSCRLHRGNKRPPLDSISSYRDLLESGLHPDTITFPSLLKSLADSRASVGGEAIHAHAIKMGFVSNVYVMNNLMRFYVVCREIGSARKLFDRFPMRDLVSWTTLISGYTKMGLSKEAVRLFLQMMDADIRVDEVTITTVLSACAKLGDLELGRKLARYVSAKKVKLDVCAWNALVDMYLRCGEIDTASKFFRKMPERNIVSWNSMISGLVRNGKPKEALSLFRRMQGEGLEPDDLTLVAVLNSCANLGALELGEWAHAYIDRKGIEADGFIGNALVDMYAKCGRIDRALGVFAGMDSRDVYSYTAMIAGFAMHGQGEEALDLFAEMSRVGVKPNEVTFIGVLSACSHAGLVDMGICHFEGMSRLYGITPRIEHYGCMVDMFGRAGLFDEAQELVNNMPVEPDAFIWGALLGACKIHGNIALGESITKRLMEIEPERDGSYVLMSNIYTSANRRRDATKMRKAMKMRKVKKTPGSSLIEIDGMVHEFRMGDKAHHQAREIYLMVDEIEVLLGDERCRTSSCLNVSEKALCRHSERSID